MKTAFFAIKKVFVHSCICFTIITLLMFLIGTAIPTFGNAIAVFDILTLYLFSVLLAMANLLLLLPRIQIGFRVLLHFLASLSCFYVVFIAIAAKITATRSILVALLFFTFLYALLMGLYLFFYFSLSTEAKKKKKDYTNIYK